MKAQRTIEKPAEIRGRGLFTGEEVSLRFKPAPPDSGVTFVRLDTQSPTRISAHVNNVTKRARRTALRNGTHAIETVEHCMAALHGLGIDNIEIEMFGGELPGGDGSSLFFVEAITNAGITDQSSQRKPLVIQDTIRVADGDAELIAVPTDNECLDVLYDLDYGPESDIP